MSFNIKSLGRLTANQINLSASDLYFKGAKTSASARVMP